MINRAVFLLLTVLIFSDCTGYRTYNKDEALKLVLNDSAQLVIGLDKWNGSEDCSGMVYMNNTGDGILITVEVKDDSVRTGNEISYQNDGIELYFDLRPRRLRNRNLYEKGVFQTVIIPLPGKKNSAPLSWYPLYYNSAVTGARAFTQVYKRGYMVQVYLPFTGLRVSHYWPRENFSFDIGINDSDVLDRESQMMWKGKSSNWNNPSNFESISLPARTPKKTTKPNILLILTDQQTIMNMSAYGNPYLRTPNMDALAEWGIRFTQSYCTSPAGSPSRSSIITGLMPHRTKVLYNGMEPDSSVSNLGELFHEAGYRTVWAGKWHLPAEFPDSKKNPDVKGFELLYFLPQERITSKGADIDAPLTEAIIKVLKRTTDRPLFLVAAYTNPHDINNVAVKPDIYPPAVNLKSTPPLPSNFAISPSEPSFIRDCRKNENLGELFGTREFDDVKWKNYLYHYYRMAESVDREIGKLINVLENKGLDQNTIIVFSSVHGDGAASHRWAGGLSPYEEAVKVPLIVCRLGKDINNLEDSRHLVSGIDIFPTLLDYAEITIPENTEGLSLKALIENPDTAWRSFLVTEILPDQQDSSKEALMIRWKKYKYIKYSYGNPGDELFDLQADPGENNNLAGLQAYSAIRREMSEMLKKWKENTGDIKK